jgi:hypothetical protein
MKKAAKINNAALARASRRAWQRACAYQQTLLRQAKQRKQPGGSALVSGDSSSSVGSENVVSKIRGEKSSAWQQSKAARNESERKKSAAYQ